MTSLDGTDGRSIQTSLRELITTRSNGMKFRLIKRLLTKKKIIIMIKKKNSRTLGLYITYSFLNFDSQQVVKLSKRFCVKTRKLFFVYLLYLY